jgi:hypothetical protein
MSTKDDFKDLMKQAWTNASPELFRQMELYAESTPNPWDNIAVAILKGLFLKKEKK